MVDRDFYYPSFFSFFFFLTKVQIHRFINNDEPIEQLVIKHVYCVTIRLT